MSNRFENNSKKTLLIISLIMILVVLFGFEKLLGNTRFGGEENQSVRHIRLKENTPNINKMLSPSDDIVALSDSLENKPYSFKIDQNGFIFPSTTHQQADKVIAFLGGSTTECMYVDEDKRFPALTGTLLETNSGKKINALNAGVSGNNSMHSINSLLNKIIPMNPDIAVLMHNINDLSILLHEKTYWNNNVHRSLLVTEDRSIKAMLKQLLPNTYNFAFEVKRKLLGDGNEFENADHGNNQPRLSNEKILSLFKSNLDSFIEISKANNITPVLMTQASRFTEKPDEVVMKNLQNLEAMGLSYPEYRSLFIAMNQVIRAVALEKSALLIDLDQAVPQTKEYMSDPVHFTNRGSELVAKIISEKLTPVIAH
ncbi:SGNH/GDSL hydrolase family protein [Cocleimonas sp. KMM 6892]|uniref:SGNH/GDSL hydrolase family protein n=1 Tax=unclassified Cocleimonas TaxID=2639732 RepID=UPI002DB7B414|nr:MULTISPECIES: SGNH/GDSL hydrolase family protein [unclassified Cocleimonas]MEB8433180.1 SGNH/GDSL hydrolase family protein [Cocleimonas sp. KMM 6892]MEC4715839.1 SGNH/GDSL hydrolase family protein [Cocleimonas sp. KMM 6895]MEC4745300.1 SGNH/GDSL hydrolase family protein [Cocleimonas sp. KMM 6896]